MLLLWFRKLSSQLKLMSFKTFRLETSASYLYVNIYVSIRISREPPGKSRVRLGESDPSQTHAQSRPFSLAISLAASLAPQTKTTMVADLSPIDFRKLSATDDTYGSYYIIWVDSNFFLVARVWLWFRAKSTTLDYDSHKGHVATVEPRFAHGFMDEKFQEELRAWQFFNEDDLRQKLSKVPGPCVLDLSEENVLSFGQGDWSLVERDISVAFSTTLAEVLLNSFKDVVQTCLAVRRELINYKKLCLHMWQAGSAVEKDLRQLASFFYCELVTGKAPDARRRRYVEIANAFNECRGAVAAIFDARHFSKAICALPRHVKSGIPWKFEELPKSLELWKPLEQAQHFLENYQQMDVFFTAFHNSESTENTNGTSKPSKPKLCTRPGLCG